MSFAKIADKLVECQDKLEIIANALERSVKLQSHYAGLLNMYDGGTRMQFKSAGEWIQRLKELDNK